MKTPTQNPPAIDTPKKLAFGLVSPQRTHIDMNVHKEILRQEKNGPRPTEWNATRKNYPAKCVHELFEEQVKKTPGAPAVSFGSDSVTYDELNQQANRTAHLLRQKGVGAETLVGICMNRSLEMVVAIFAILKAGAAFVPVDPEYPPERTEFMLRDSQMPLVLVHGDTADGIRARGIPSISVDLAAQIRYEPVQNLPRHSGPKNLAYVIYTSGSTGKPKGVMISHDALCNHTCWMQEQFPLGSEDCVLQKTSFSFDASIWEFFSPLSFGAHLLMAKPGWHRDVGYLAREICEKKITILQMVPSTLRLLLEGPRFKECRTLQRLFCGGEPLAADLAHRFSSVLDATLINLYGPTEATIDSTFWICPPGETPAVIPIGKPIANATVHLLDPQLRPVSNGETGELCIGGRGLARGYLNQPELTARKFIADPFNKEAQARLYKTGDLARRLPDGNLEYLGRIDQQVKIRGHRIEPAEIESALCCHLSIQNAVALAREDTPGQKRLVAYVKARTSQAPAATELRSFLRTKLPEHMIPDAFVALADFPLTPSGKIHRNLLPAPQQSPSPENQIPPETPLEKDIAAIWGEVFQIDRIGAEDSFFDMGGHSLLAMQILIRVREKFGVELSLQVVFEGATVRRMAQAVLMKKPVKKNEGDLDELLVAISENRHDRVSQPSTHDAKQISPERIY